MSVTGVPSFAEVRTIASHAAYQRADVLLVAEKQHRLRQPAPVREPFEPLPIDAVADEQEQRVDATLTERGERVEQVVRPLDGCHAAEPADDEAVGGDPDARPDRRPAPRRTRREARGRCRAG